MRLPQKYFKHFIGIIAVIAIIAIIYGTLEYRKNSIIEFKNKVFSENTLKDYTFKLYFEDDSLKISELSKPYVVVDFWATWSDLSLESHSGLAKLVRNYDSLMVIAATVKDNVSNIKTYRDKHNFPFIYVEGTEVYNRLNIPGLPTQVIFDKDRNVRTIYVGFRDSTRYGNVRTYLKNE